ncbi:structure-specific endonuclease subunit SLX4 [Drosophila tropicalis]|uniref:structure-specific endonuclease subunit SLX4 n=1 Tax=Drosophila tropicalis TaxID=46794 RepID=UPI0035AB91F9
MDRNTRRANFRKLQEAAKNNNNEPKVGMSSALSLSAYFDNEEAKNPATNPSSVRKTKSNQVFEQPGPRPKKAPKLNSKGVSSRKGKATPKTNRKQPSISDFLRNEQIFSEVTAQHCLADNFSPDDIEMALALSKSEADKLSKQYPMHNGDEDEVVNLIGDERPEGSSESIRRKLQKYGFRTAAKEDYNPLSYAAALPVLGKRGKRAKWANKFTPLTLRNPEVQQRKFEKKVAALLKECDVKTKQVELEMPPYILISSHLQRIEATLELSIIKEPTDDPIELNLYYVKDLIEISYTPAEHLLKDWSAIQGRDLSPKRLNPKSVKRLEQFEMVYKDLEKHFDNGRTNEMELDDLEQLVIENMVEDVSQVDEPEPIPSTNSSPLKEPPDKRVRLSPEKEHFLSNSKIQPISTSSSTSLSLPQSSTRCTSPDLFADSDEDSDVKNLSLNVYKNVSCHDKSSQITTYEIYTSSSDEVKTVSEATPQQISNQDDIIDLTQGGAKDDKFNHSIESDSDIDNLNYTLVVAKKSQEPKSYENGFIAASQLDFKTSPLSFCDWNNLDKSISDAKTNLEITSTSKSVENISQSSLRLDLETSPLSFRHWNNSDASKMNSFGSRLNNSSINYSHSSLQLDSLEASLKKHSKNMSQTSLHLDLETSPLSFRHWNSSDKSMAEKSPRSFTQWNTSAKSLPDSIASCKLALHSFDSNVSIDLTQNSDNDDGILLSDDEINYSIWKANKTMARDVQQDPNFNGSDDEAFSPLPKSIADAKSTIEHFKTVEDLDIYLKNSASSINLIKERAEFGILEDKGLSQPFQTSQSSVRNFQMDIDWSDASFLEPINKPVFKRKSSHRFQEFLGETVKRVEDEFDEFDRMVFQDLKDPIMNEAIMPSGLDQLLKGEINVETIPEPKMLMPNKPEQLEFNGKVYHISVCNTVKPDFTKLSESMLLQQLYNYGIKPLKRKQAIKILEYIYNQTHPIMKEEFKESGNNLQRSKSTPAPPIITDRPSCSLSRQVHTFSSGHNELTKVVQTSDSNKFHDACGSQLLRFSQTQAPSLCDNFEFYILQTNVTKKTPQPLVPFHIAWHNLICANPQLHESLLMYEPIDLQEIYMHFKQMGHRYDPKRTEIIF